ncbi:MAG: hypothetical protein NTY77_08940 [Elusimicrobia bacterium]|nr:hypothetical protein [Elusimicrobiota bacterium]
MAKDDSRLSALWAELLQRLSTDWRAGFVAVGGFSLAILAVWLTAFHEPSHRSHSAQPFASRPGAGAAVAAGRAAGGAAGRAADSGPGFSLPGLIRGFWTQAGAVAGAKGAAASAQARDSAAGSAGLSAASAMSAPQTASLGQGGAPVQGAEQAGSARLQGGVALGAGAGRQVSSAQAAGAGRQGSAAARRPSGAPLTPFDQSQKRAPPSDLRADGAAKGSFGFKSPGAAVSGSGSLGGGSSGASAAAAAPASRSGLAVVPMQSGAVGQPGSIAAAGGSGGASGGASGGDSGEAGVLGGASSYSGGGAAGGGAAGGAAPAAAAASDNSDAYRKNAEDARKCEAATNAYQPKIEQANGELDGIARRMGDVCRSNVKCVFAYESVCRDDYWMWRSHCNCARVHCQFKAKCEEIDRLDCAQLHGCPLTASQPCTQSDCDK